MSPPASRLPALAFTLTLVVVTALLLAAFLYGERHYLGQPLHDGRVVDVALTGEQDRCGRRCRCEEALVTVQVEDGSFARAFACSDKYALDQPVTVRQAPEEPEAQIDPLPLPLLVLFLCLAVGAGLFVLARLRPWQQLRPARPTAWADPTAKA